jgi:hypothetical protein
MRRVIHDEGRIHQRLRAIFEAPSEEGAWKGFSSGTFDRDGKQPAQPSTEVNLPQELKEQFGTSQHRDPDLREAMWKVKVSTGGISTVQVSPLFPTAFCIGSCNDGVKNRNY